MASGKKRRSRVRNTDTRPVTAGMRGVRSTDGRKSARPSSVADLFGGGEEGNLLQGRYADDPKVYAWFQRRHRKALPLIDEDGVYRTADGEHEWSVPYGVRVALKAPLTRSQISTKYPFYVTWQSPVTGRRLIKYFMSIPHAIEFIATKAQYVDEDAAIVARHGFDIPEKLRGKFPRRSKDGKKMFYWCPRCMAPRRISRTGDVFFSQKKIWDDKKSCYIWRDVKLALMACSVCHGTNRDTKFRRSNQPWETRKIKQGVRRIKKRRR